MASKQETCLGELSEDRVMGYPPNVSLPSKPDNPSLRSSKEKASRTPVEIRKNGRMEAPRAAKERYGGVGRSLVCPPAIG
jgi:hypothetical protein